MNEKDEEKGLVKINKSSTSGPGLNCCSDGDNYPYGTSLNFDTDIVDNLGIDALAVGDVVEIRGYAFVDTRSEYSNKNESNKSIRFQMTSIKVSREEDDRVKQLYGE